MPANESPCRGLPPLRRRPAVIIQAGSSQLAAAFLRLGGSGVTSPAAWAFVLLRGLWQRLTCTYTLLGADCSLELLAYGLQLEEGYEGSMPCLLKWPRVMAEHSVSPHRRNEVPPSALFLPVHLSHPSLARLLQTCTDRPLCSLCSSPVLLFLASARRLQPST